VGFGSSASFYFVAPGAGMKDESVYSYDPIEDFVMSILDDDEGISLESFNKLVYMLSLMDMQDLLTTLDDNIDIQDDRVFLPEQMFEEE
jgi:hypothetical protein